MPEATPAGFLPDVADEQAFRLWLTNTLKLPEILAGLTPTPYDDMAVALLQAIVATDETWAAFYEMFEHKLAAGPAAWNWAKIAEALTEIIRAIAKLFA